MNVKHCKAFHKKKKTKCDRMSIHTRIREKNKTNKLYSTMLFILMDLDECHTTVKYSVAVQRLLKTFFNMKF